MSRFGKTVGSVDAADWAADAQIAAGQTPDVADAARGFFEQLSLANPDSNFTLTGHSLGGYLANCVAGAKWHHHPLESRQQAAPSGVARGVLIPKCQNV
jgi:alpha-beta hydrolase superfamily lysophospholipase